MAGQPFLSLYSVLPGLSLKQALVRGLCKVSSEELDAPLSQPLAETSVSWPDPSNSLSWSNCYLSARTLTPPMLPASGQDLRVQMHFVFLSLFSQDVAIAKWPSQDKG